MWIVTVTYGWYQLQPGRRRQGPEPPGHAHRSVLVRAQRRRDRPRHRQNGDTVLNTAGDPYDPPVVIDDPRLVMTPSVRNEAKFNVGWVLAYRNAVNSDPFAGFPPLVAKVLISARAREWHQDAGWYYQATYEYEFLTSNIDYDTQTGFPGGSS